MKKASELILFIFLSLAVIDRVLEISWCSLDSEILEILLKYGELRDSEYLVF